MYNREGFFSVFLNAGLDCASLQEVYFVASVSCLVVLVESLLVGMQIGVWCWKVRKDIVVGRHFRSSRISRLFLLLLYCSLLEAICLS